ncbi:DNA repair protein RecO, partial [Candidatus Omnitrophota bacterium]
MICRDEAIVLKTRDFRETSRIAVFYSKKSGKVSGLLKGIRKDPRKFASN